jgi:hypothetical protein
MKTPEEIAELIRDKFDPDYAQKVHPDDQHLYNLAKDVANVLHVEPSALMINHITGLITRHVERPSAEYPKMVYHHGKRQQQTVANRAEEDELVSGGWVHHHWNAPKPERRRWREPEPVAQQLEPVAKEPFPFQQEPSVILEHGTSENDPVAKEPEPVDQDEASQDKPPRTKASRTKPPRE